MLLSNGLTYLISTERNGILQRATVQQNYIEILLGIGVNAGHAIDSKLHLLMYYDLKPTCSETYIKRASGRSCN